MRNLTLWISLVLISVSPLYLIHICEVPNILIGLAVLIIATIIFIFSPYNFNIERRSSILLSMVFLPLSLFLKFPFNIGFILLFIVTIFEILVHRFEKFKKYRKILKGIFLTGFSSVIVYSFYPIYALLFSHYHRVDILSPVISDLLTLFGVRSSINNGLIYIQTYYQTYPLTVTWEKLCIFIWINLLLLFLLFSLLYSKKKNFYKNLAVFLISTWVYIILRFVFIIINYSYSLDLNTFWDTNLILISFIPLSLLLAPLIKFDKTRLVIENINKKQITSLLLIFLFIFLLIGAFVFEDPGIKKEGRILIDEFHSDWENTTIPIDKNWYGELSTYNYYCWARWLDIYYDVDINTNQSLTYNLLKNYDILILKCPTSLYSSEEIDDILSFVEEGGGLYLIGDHTDVFGMNTYLNQISRYFGIIFKIDATYELKTGNLSKYKPPFLFAHPIVKDLDDFEFQTSCSLDVPIDCKNVIIGYGLLGEPGTYSTSAFFREPFSAPDVEYGLLVQVAAVHYGRGRVVAFTDSTCFSNFCMFMDGYKKFNLGTIEYLNRMNAYSYLNKIFAIFSIISFILSLIFLSKENKGRLLFILLFSASLAFLLSAPLFDQINSLNYQLPSDKIEHPKVCFDMSHSDIKISPSAGLRLYRREDVYNTFFVWTQRVGWIPSVEKSLESCISKGDALVIINPNKDFNKGEIDKLKEFANKGGKILLIDSIINKFSTANQILDSFNMTIIKKSINSSIGNGTYTIGNVTYPHLIVEGGDFNFSFDNNTLLSIKTLGSGKIVVFVDSYTFSNEVMGDTFTEPDEKLRSIYDIEYYIFEKILSEE